MGGPRCGAVPPRTTSAAAGQVSAYYNENDPYAAQWLRNLVAAGHIAPGDVDERSIVDVRPDDLKGYAQCHFFAGIGGWSLALRLSLWPDDRHVWTGSCPCQPFSAAGRGKAANDERHLWPAWFSLIRECRPATVFGEQVEAAIGWGWLDAVFADMEAEGYACASAVLPACGVGAPHIRQRLWFVADADAARCGTGRPGEAGDDGAARLKPSGLRADGMEYAASEQMGLSGRARQSGAADSVMGDALFAGFQRARDEQGETQTGSRGRQFGLPDNPWAGLVWLPCTDGKARPTQSGIFPLAHGVSARVGKLRAAGNAIVPALAAEFIRAIGDS